MSKYKPTGRKRGAPVGNTNALKHGIYSRCISVTEDEELEPMPLDKSQHELALTRVRLMQCIQKQQEASAGDWLAYEKAIAYYLRIIVSLTTRNALLGQNRKTAYITVMEMIRQVNEEQDVR